MKEIIIAFGLFLFIEGIIYALFPSKMKNMLKKLEMVKDSQLRTGGLFFCNHWFFNYLVCKKLKWKQLNSYFIVFYLQVLPIL